MYVCVCVRPKMCSASPCMYMCVYYTVRIIITVVGTKNHTTNPNNTTNNRWSAVPVLFFFSCFSSLFSNTHFFSISLKYATGGKGPYVFPEPVSANELVSTKREPNRSYGCTKNLVASSTDARWNQKFESETVVVLCRVITLCTH